MTSSDDAAMPPDVLAVFLEIRRLVDAAIGELEAAASPQAVTGTIVSTLPTFQSHATATFLAEDVRRARVWLTKAKLPGAFVAGKYGDALADRAVDGTLELVRLGDLLDVFERWLA